MWNLIISIPDHCLSFLLFRSSITISFYLNNIDLLFPKPKISFRHLKEDIQEFHRKYVLVPTDKAANNVVVV